jgi:hypothetical protein
MKVPSNWIDELEMLAWRFAHLGIGPEVGGLLALELAGLYAYLMRLADATG